MLNGNHHNQPAKELAEALKGSRFNNHYMAQCPAHDDDKASLAIREEDGRVLLHCHAGCTQDAVLDALRRRDLWPERQDRSGSDKSRAIVATYDYVDEDGAVLYQTVRFVPKDFRQRRPDATAKGGWAWNLKGVRLVPYRLPDLLEAVALARPVFVVEGEKDVDSLAKLGITATCNAGGAKKWGPELSACLPGADVVIIPDNDEAGRKHVEKVATSLKGIATRIRVLTLPDLPEKGDVSDWLAAGGDAAKLWALVDKSNDWSKPAAAQQPAAAPGDDFPEWRIEPWPETVNGAELLTEVEKMIERYMVLPAHAAKTAALWILHAWSIDCFEISPFLVISSPTKQCGKTTLLILLNYLSPRSIMASNISPAAIFRFVEQEHPTLLIDEADSFARDNEELRGILNSGHTRPTARVIRVDGEGERRRARAFSTWSPKIIASIGALPSTVMDRSLIVMMRRKRNSEQVERLRMRDNDDFTRLRRRALRWANDNAAALRSSDPDVPAINRSADNWRPLLAVADLAGGAWPKLGRTAAVELSKDGGRDTERAIELLGDRRQSVSGLVAAIFQHFRGGKIMDREPLDSGRIYTVAQRISALTTGPTEVLSLIASSQSKVELIRLDMGQTSTAPVVGMFAELFRHTSASTGGSTAGGALTPVNIRGHAAAPASTSAAVRFFADTFAMDSGKFAWAPPFPETVDVNQRFHARITSLTTLGLGGLTASLTFRETGRVPG